LQKQKVPAAFIGPPVTQRVVGVQETADTEVTVPVPPPPPDVPVANKPKSLFLKLILLRI
jgi:hypothetical protein